METNISNGSNEFDMPDMSILDISDEQVQGNQSDVSQQTGQIPMPDIDPKFIDLDPVEARYRTIQSRHDKLAAEKQKIEEAYSKAMKAEMFLEELLENPELFESFVAEIRPDMVRKKDISVIMQEKLAQEFPEFKDHKPSKQDAEMNPGSREWLFYKRVDDLYNELAKGGYSEKLMTVKEYRERQALKKKEQEALAQKEIADLKQKMNWDDAKVQRYIDWATKLTNVDLAKMFNYLLRMQQISNPSVATTPGKPVGSISAQNFLNSI